MPESVIEVADLLDLKLLPAWLKETETKRFERYTGEEGEVRPRRDKRDFREKHQKPRLGRESKNFRKRDRHDRRPQDGQRRERRPEDRSKPAPAAPPLQVTVRFLPQPRVLESVIAQIESGAVAYSLFQLARLFLEKPERYEVHVALKPEATGAPLYQLGENGPVSSDRQFLERNAFRLGREHFYKIEISQGEPIKGNFMSVARDPLSGTLLGPTNYHAYQPRLRTLYERRFSRRMSFADYQRQIEIVSDPALVERWKEEAQKITTYTTLREEPPLTFSSEIEVERHFQANYFPGLVRSVSELAINGVMSRSLADRALHRSIEDAWAHEIRSPSNMMQALATGFRQAGLNIFRHRRGMLFISPIRPAALVHEQAGVSPAVNAVLEILTATPGIGRKELADKLIVDLSSDEAEARKLALASDLHWLIGAGHVIEFNDGSLDLPRLKSKAVAAAEPAADQTSTQEMTA